MKPTDQYMCWCVLYGYDGVLRHVDCKCKLICVLITYRFKYCSLTFNTVFELNFIFKTLLKIIMLLF